MSLVRLKVICVFLAVLVALSGKSFGTCSVPVSVNPSTISFGNGPGSGSFGVATGGSGFASCTWSANSANSFISGILPASGGGGSTFNFTVNFNIAANPDLAVRTGTIVVTQSDNSQANVTVSQAAATGGFTVSVSPTSQTVIAGVSTSYNVSVTRSGGFVGSVCFNATQLPANTNASFSPSCTTGGSSTLTVSTTGATPAGSFGFTIKGVNGAVTESTPATLVVNPGVAKGITTAFDPVADTMEVDFVSTDAHVRQFSFNGAWSQFDLSAITGAPNATTSGPGIKTIYNSLANSMEVHYIGADQHVHTLWFSAGWHHTDISAATGAPPAALNSSLAASMDPIANTEDVEYIGTDQHVHELWYNGTWHTTDITVASGAAANADSSSGINTLMNTFANAMEVHYIGTDHHIYSLWYPLGGGGAWHSVDHTTLEGAPLAQSGSPLTSAIDSIASTEDLEYVNTSQHVEQLWYSGGWHPNDLTVSSGAANLASNGGMHTLVNTIANTMEVHYVGTDQHVYALSYNGTWHSSDLTITTGAPAAVPNSPLTSAADSVANTIDIEYVGTDQHVHQLWYNGTWHITDLSAVAP